MFTKNSKVYVAGHNGLVGSAIVRELKRKGYRKIITVSKKKLDLTNQTKTLQFLKYLNLLRAHFLDHRRQWIDKLKEELIYT